MTDTQKKNPQKEPDPAEPTGLSDSCFSKSVCSAMDCTGLIPALPSTEAELEAYEEMYQFCLTGASARSSPTATDSLIPHPKLPEDR